jgi:hypothetical protein
MWSRIDNQDVGSEAAIIERVRNSSLVKWFRAEDPTGLKLGTEATGLAANRLRGGRGASRSAAKVDRKDGWSVRECECRHE